MVSGNGNFTISRQHHTLIHQGKEKKEKHTNNKSREKRINPAHNQCLRNHHHHIPLHHAHHGIHARGIRHGISRRLATILRVLQERAVLVRGDEVVFSRGEGFSGEHPAVVAQVDAAEDGGAFAGLGEG